MPLHTQTDAKETSFSFVAQSWKTVAQVYILFHTAFCLPVRNTFEANFYDVRALFACTLNVILWYFSVYIPELYVCTVVWDHRKNLFLNSQCWDKASQEEKLRGERASFNSQAQVLGKVKQLVISTGKSMERMNAGPPVLSSFPLVFISQRI